VKLYSIFDRAVGAYMQPFAAHSNAHAIRMFNDTTNDTSTAMNKHPEDYFLDFIADFNETTGQTSGEPVRIAKATDYKTVEPPLDISEALKRRNAK
jgi:hypothetical protein